MCNAGSYIETNEDVEQLDSLEYVKSGTKILFVTSDDLKTAKGKKVLESGERTYSHTAIKQIFGVKSGVEKEADLSDPDNMPPQIAEAVRKGKFVGVFIKPDLLSEKGAKEFEKAQQKIDDMKKEPKNGKQYAVTEAFWKIFKASAANRVETWK